MLLFPEMSLTGFSMNTEITADENGESVEFVKKIADKYKMTKEDFFKNFGEEMVKYDLKVKKVFDILKGEK